MNLHRNQVADQYLVSTPTNTLAVRTDEVSTPLQTQAARGFLAFAGLDRLFGAKQHRPRLVPRPTQKITICNESTETELGNTRCKTLLTVSTVIDDNLEAQIAQQMRPRVDYLEMARTFQADLIDYAEARRMGGWFGRWLEKMGGPNLTLAWASFLQRNNYEVIFTDGEQIGIPLAWFCRLCGTQGARHVMITHILSVYKKMIFFDLFRLQNHVDTFLVYSTWQKRFIEQRWQLAPGRVAYTPFMVDTKFFSPAAVIPNPRRMISSAGLECRDYPTLIKVAFQLDVQVVIAAGSPFSKRRDTTENLLLPPNVSINRLTQYELRQLYADSLFVVVPLYNVDFQAGVTVILEAMAMEKAVICSGTPGQTDVVVDGETGLYVPAEDPDALQTAIEYLLAHPAEAERMGKAGRRLVEQEMSLDCYTERLNCYVQAAMAKAAPVVTARQSNQGRFSFDQNFEKNTEDVTS
ncbi:MAG: glycosyltransferase family 4 protein [Caldilineaceae bacterium]|nr:glycosyltransferase family 4 protein [Caldilineaceae bacterium]